MISVISSDCFSCLSALFNATAEVSRVNRTSDTVDDSAFSEDSSCTAKTIKKSSVKDRKKLLSEEIGFRRNADEIFELLPEMALVIKTKLRGNVGNRCSAQE